MLCRLTFLEYLFLISDNGLYFIKKFFIIKRVYLLINYTQLVGKDRPECKGGEDVIVLISKNTLQNGKEREFLEIAKKMAEATRKEAGCCFYRLAKDEKEPDLYYFIEAYEDNAALEVHRNSPHFQNYVPLLGKTRTKPSELTKCEVIEI